MTTTTKANSRRTQLNSKEKDVRKEKASSTTQKAKVKAKVEAKARDIRATETAPRSKNLK